MNVNRLTAKQSNRWMTQQTKKHTYIILANAIGLFNWIKHQTEISHSLRVDGSNPSLVN